ncbi:Uncharacterised protein family (UPF0180) [Evansella caseinilytica]|uniref:UPF0180 protein SAMN05421736_103306 n=1 Tax=Evansella caseinilytica TaxID=1503961 RepID=A0A1H3MQB4_9BACI|nr:YkuS family protein [Evansella caseinilytica]SDY78857.1 Uncharacterised protein family (UPF0180) [Evansella caseinilytica]
MPKIGVEQSLTDVQEALQERGYDVIQLRQEQDAAECDCCVITGQDRNVMGIQDVAMEGTVIDAHGRTAEEICQEVESRIRQ